MKHAVAGDIVFAPSGHVYDRVRVILGKAYRLRNGLLTKIDSKVEVVNENVFRSEILEEPVIPGVPGSRSQVPSGTQDQERLDDETTIPGGSVPLGEPSPSPESPGSGTVVGSGPTIPGGITIPSIPRTDPRNSGQRSEFVDIRGTTVPAQPIVNIVGQFGTRTASPATGGSRAGSPAGTGMSDELDLKVPSFDQNDYDQFNSVEGGDSTKPEAYLPQMILDSNSDDIFSEGIPFRPRLSVFKSQSPETGWDVYSCRLKIPGLLELVAQTGESTREILNRLSEFETISPFVVYILGVKGVLEEAITQNRLLTDYQFDFPLMDYDDPQVSDLTVEAKYNFYDPAFEKNSGWTKESEVPNFYFMGKESGNFSLKNIDYLNANGTDSSFLMVSSSQDEMNLVNHYFSYGDAIPFSVNIESDVEYSRFADLLGTQKLLKQFGLNLSSPNRGLTYFCDRKNVAIGTDSTGMLCSADTFKTRHWLEGLYAKTATIYTQEQADSTVLSLLPTQEAAGTDQNKTLRSGQAQNVMLEMDRIVLNGARDIFDCISDKKSEKERVGFQVNKTRSGIVHKLFGLSSGSPFSRMKLVDSQVFYGKPYQYDVHGIYSVIANEYYYLEHSFKPLFDVENLELFFSIKMRPAAMSVVLPNFTKRINVLSALPLPPTVQVEQYRDLSSDKADVLFLFKNTTETMIGEFKEIESGDAAFARLVQETFGQQVPFRNDDPIVKIEAFRLDIAPTSLTDFVEGQKFEISNSVKVNDTTTFLDSNSFLDSIPMDKEFYYVFRQIDVHGLYSSPTNIFQVVATRIGSRYRVICRDWTIEEFLESRKPKTYEFKTAKKFVCILPDEEKMKSRDSFSKQYRLRLVSTQSKRSVSVDFEVKMAENSETY